jgi:paraquat-inducible protein B
MGFSRAAAYGESGHRTALRVLNIHSPVARLKWDQAPQGCRWRSSSRIEEKLTALLDKLDALPLGAMAGDVRDVMREARMTLKSINGLTRDVDEKALPKFVAAVEEARSALNAAERMLDGASATLAGPDAPGQRELRSALQEMTRAARSLRLLSDSIELHPESLLRGRRAEANPQ